MQSGTNLRTCRRQRPTAWVADLSVTLALAASVAWCVPLVAQTPAAPSSPKTAPLSTLPSHHSIPAHRPTRVHGKAVPVTPATPAPAQPVAQSVPPEPPKPNWPVNDKPVPAKVTWDTQGLSIEANNSSLEQILSEVATDTGAKLDGKVGDERVFGSFGPGPARDIVAQLLYGTTYNVLMVGDQGAGTPREIVLSNRPTGPAPTNNNNAQNNNNAEDESEYEQPQQPVPGAPPVRNGFGPQGMPPDQNQQNPDERRAEFEQRMEQMRQQQVEQQQQQQQQQPQTPPQ